MSAVQAKVEKAAQMLGTGRADAALALLQGLARTHPGDADVAGMLCLALTRLGRFEQAAHYGQRACELRPGDASLVYHAAHALQGSGRGAEARSLLERGVAQSPADAPLRLALANALLDDYRAADALTHCEAALARGMDAQIVVTYAGALLSLCEPARAIEALRTAMVTCAEHDNVIAALASALNYAPGTDPAESLRVHRRFGELLERDVPPHRPVPRVTRGHAGRLRIGFLSPDLRTHSVAFFLEPLIEHLDPVAFESVAYFTSMHADATTARLRPKFGLWRECHGKTPLQIAAMIADDRVDILVDLAGHTQGSGLLVLALKPAPLQVTYLGYPNTTGLRAVELRVVDSHTDPAGSEAFATEQLVRLDPCFLCYRPPTDAPEPALTPHEGVVFGSFNASQKINRPLLNLWARVLREVPGSRLRLKSLLGLREPGVRAFFERAFAEEGIDPSRVECLPAATTTREHLALYSGIDIALDTQPYHGTTTTCEALWMGVPVVTLAGVVHAQRVGVSLLSAAGLPELIAPDEDAYVRIAADLAGDPPHLAALRRDLRARVAASPLCDERGFAARFGQAMLAAWNAAPSA